MPLDYSKSQAAFKKNVAQLMRDGKKPKVALAIAYSILRGDTHKPKEEERCWKGYEPVPGKKPFSPGSCRKEERP